MKPAHEAVDATTLMGALKSHGMTHLIGLPDNMSARLFEIGARDPELRLLTVTREGEAFAIASGLWVGGRVPVVLIQNTGLLEAGDALRGTATRMGIPLVVLVTCRGYATLTSAHWDPDPIVARDVLVRPDLDSAAIMTEPTLRAWGIPHLSFEKSRDDVSEAWRLAEQESRPVALLITRALT